MTFFSRAFTGLTSLATGVFFILLTTASLRATAIHSQSGNTKYAAITLGAAFLLFIVALFFALPTPRSKLIYATFSAPARAIFSALFIPFFGIVAALLAASQNVADNPLLLGASQTMVLGALGCLTLAFLVTFLLPGVAYSELRTAYLEVQTFGRSRATSYDNAIDTTKSQIHHGLLAKMLAGVFGLANLAVMALAIYGLVYAQFISSAAHVSFVKENSIWLILSYGTTIFIGYYFGRKSKGLIRNQFLRRVFVVVFLTPWAFLAIPAAQSGLPAVLSLQEDGRYDTILVKVVKRGRLSSRRSCDRKATVIWEVHNRQLCNVPEHIWRDLEPGQTLELEGFLTNYGFRYERMRRAS